MCKQAIFVFLVKSEQRFDIGQFHISHKYSHANHGSHVHEWAAKNMVAWYFACMDVVNSVKDFYVSVLTTKITDLLVFYE